MSQRIYRSGNKRRKYARYKEAWRLPHEAVAKKDASGAVDDPDALPGEIPDLRGAIESAPSVGLDPDRL